jgi:hypothetical protein
MSHCFTHDQILTKAPCVMPPCEGNKKTLWYVCYVRISHERVLTYSCSNLRSFLAMTELQFFFKNLQATKLY